MVIYRNPEDVEIEEIGNNLYIVNGMRIYAPCFSDAYKKYLKLKDGGK